MSHPRKSSNTEEAVEALVILIETKGIDITSNYDDWVRIAFALVNTFGADGESFFHRISAFYPDYSFDEAADKYAKCLHSYVPSAKSQVTIGTLFFIAAQHGIDIPFPRSEEVRASISPASHHSATPKVAELAELAEKSPLAFGEKPLSTFSQSIHEDLPLLLQRVIADSHSDEDADILILGTLTVISACTPNVYGIYDRRPVHPNLFLYVTAPASAGKGRLSLCRHLAAPLHQALRDKYKKAMQEYNEQLAEYAINKKTAMGIPPKEPPFLTLFVPANSTATIVYQTLSENNGVGLLFETEGDTLANAFNSDLGNYSDGFRKAFHHEPISYLRKKDHEYVEILRPKFSAVLSGTRQQVFNLIPDAENGLFSRFIFYSMQTELVWRDMFPTIDGATADERFRQIGKDFYAFLKDFPDGDVQFTLSHTQKKRFNEFFTETQQTYASDLGDDIVASIRRLGLIFFRIAMILSILRLMDHAPLAARRGAGGEAIAELKKSKCIVCTDIDFQSSLDIVKVLLQHSVEIYQSLPRHSYERIASNAPKGSRQLAEAVRARLFDALPDSFDRPTYIEIAASLDINVRTAERYISDFCSSGRLLHPSNSQYLKP